MKTELYPSDYLSSKHPYYIIQCNIQNFGYYFYAYYDKAFAYMDSSTTVAVFKVTPKSK